jgi:hydrogenase nickel incorporation protein HypA/HybF
MHEIAVVRPIISIVGKYARENNVKKVKAVRLKVGEMHDFQSEWIQKYFHQFIEGTPLEGTEIVVNKIPIVFKCDNCGDYLVFDYFTFAGADIKCRKCGSESMQLKSGKEFEIEGIEVES